MTAPIARATRGSRINSFCQRRAHTNKVDGVGGIAAGETFGGTFPFRAHFTTRPGFRMHYVDEGAGEPIILIHGEPTWAYLYRNFIPALSGHFRVIAPDHMGFGKSETPAGADYTLDRHARNLGSLREERLTPWFAAIKSMEEAGQLEAVLGNLKYLVGGIMMTLGIQRREVVTDTWLQAYAAAFPTFEECRAAIAFPLEGLHLERIRETLVSALPGLFKLGQAGVPAMMIEGMRDRAIWPHVAIAGFRAFFPRGTVHELADAGHFIQEDAPETVVPLIEEFCLRT